ncbi:YybH family protein [Tateyamaria sp. SN3-11]|uniref:YybH family protein n=1 Tax=Tateyamaria sp. SN3-11 TaxID=3092147 RepID=UPI0039EA4799
MLLKNMTIAFAIALMCQMAMAQDQDDDVSAIAAIDQEFEEALAAGSAERMASVYTSNGQALPPNGEIVEGHESLTAFWQGAIDAGFASADLEQVELEIFGENAIQVGRYVLTMRDGSIADQGKLMIHWKQEAGEWRWHRDIWNSSLPAN